MGLSTADNLREAMRQIPSGLFIITCADEDERGGCLLKWVQQCADDPPMVMIALPRGLPLEPLIRNSRRFVLCQISADDRFLERKFAQCAPRDDDPFESLDIQATAGGPPIIKRAMSYLDCEVIRHVELEADRRVLVGQVHAGGMLNNDTEPAVHIGSKTKQCNKHNRNGAE